MKLKDKVIWVTGASSGIGKALVGLLNEKGNKLILSSRQEEELEKVAKELALRDYLILPLDLSDFSSLEEKAKMVYQKYGRLDCLIHNGGISQRSKAVDTDFEVDEKIIAINLLGPIALTKAVFKVFSDHQKIHFVVTSSLAGKFGVQLRSAYCAAKHGLHGFFESLRTEIACFGGKVTMLCPGFINTDISNNALLGDGKKYGEKDKSQAKGIGVLKCAKWIVRAVELDREEVIIGGPERHMVMLKRFFPKVLNRIMRNRKPN